MPSLEKVWQEILLLSIEQKKNLLTRLQQVYGSVEKNNCQEIDKDIYVAFVAILKKFMPLSVINRHYKYGKMWRNGIIAISEYIKDFPDIETGPRRVKLFLILASSIVGWLREYNLPITISTIAAGMTKINQVMELAFPGYAESGLLSWIGK